VSSEIADAARETEEQPVAYRLRPRARQRRQVVQARRLQATNLPREAHEV
jgi:hypothetical protein